MSQNKQNRGTDWASFVAVSTLSHDLDHVSSSLCLLLRNNKDDFDGVDEIKSLLQTCQTVTIDFLAGTSLFFSNFSFLYCVSNRRHSNHIDKSPKNHFTRSHVSDAGRVALGNAS